MSSSQPIDIHYHMLEEWITDRKAVLSKINSKHLKEVSDLAPQMVQICKYDIPSLKKQQNRLRTQSEEFCRKLDNSFGQEDKLRKKILMDMSRFGLLQMINPDLDLSFLTSSSASKSTRDHIAQMEAAVESSKVFFSNNDDILEARLNSAFSTLCDRIADACDKVLPNAFECYESFLLESIKVNRKLISAIPSGGKEEEVNDECILPNSIKKETLFTVLVKLLELKDEVMAPGTRGVTEWVPNSHLADTSVPQEEVAVEISWGDDDTCGTAPTATGTESVSGVEIDWGCLDGGETEDVGCSHIEELTKSQDNKGLTDNELEYKKPLTEGGIVFSYISQMMSRPEVRGSIIDELEALSAFFTESLRPSKAMELPIMTMDRVAKHRVALNGIEKDFLQLLRDDTVIDLLRIRSDVSCRTAFVDGLLRANSFINTLVSTRSEFVALSESAAAEAKSLDPVIEEAVKKVLDMRSKAEELMSKMLTRPVYIVGDINTL